MKKRYLIATIKSWNIEHFGKLKAKYPECDFVLVSSRNKLTISFLEEYKPVYIFFPHWSWIIPKEIYDAYHCVVFHSTDLPFGRGGSPLQNLIVRGIYQTKISAIKVREGVDAGSVYFKEPIDIGEGSADDILKRISDIVFEKMIPRFLNETIIPVEQSGEITTFKRRTPEQSEIPGGLNKRQLYDYIRMLDGVGYPTAFMQYGEGKIFYTEAKLENGVLTATARFVEEDYSE